MDEDLSLPRILCLHGGGTNAEIFAIQSRAIAAALQPYFRFVYFNGPFTASPHPDIASVYGDMAPFHRWLRWLPDQEVVTDEESAKLVMDSVLTAMRKDRGSGPWAGVMGFSQGAKIAANLLWNQQQALKHGVKPQTNFRFAVSMAGLPPWLHLDTRVPIPERYVDGAGGNAVDFHDWPETCEGDHVLEAPTLHVLGLQDPDVKMHRLFAEKYFKPESTRIYEWDGGHRVPVSKQDVSAIVKHITDIAEEVEMIWW